MTRDEFLEKCDLLRYETKYSTEPWHVWLAEMAANDAEQRRVVVLVPQAEKVRGG